MFRKTIMSAAMAVVAAAPIAAHAAPERAPAPLGAKEDLGSGFSGVLWPVLVAVAVGVAIILITDGDDDPVSP